ncbi:MAG: sulfite exporter TauE/SafE family protein [Alphaproteobacteria bacterium]|nr:sulfite exporter TauE/SafE family protein [Alphaproteobacteria bacterium]
MTDPVFWLVAALAVFIVALAKSGLVGSLGVAGVPILTLVMAPREAAGVLLPLMLIMDLFAVWAYRREIDWANLAILVPGALAGIALGWAMSSIVSDEMVLLVIGIISLLFILDAVFPLRRKIVGKPPSRPWGIFWGGIAGFTSFISHSGGPPFQIYVLPQRLKPAVYAATSAWCFAIINVTKLVPYYFLGQLSVASLEISVLLVPVAILGVLLGIYLVRRVSVELFYKIAYVLVFLLSLKLIYDGTVGVFGL